MSLIDRVVLALFGDRPDKEAVADQALVDDLTEAIVDIVEPRVRLRTGYRDQLADGVRATIAHLRELGHAVLEPIVLSRAAWSQDPHVRAFFVSPDDVPAFIGHSREAREFFDQHPGCDLAYALLGMKREERRVLAPRMEGGVMRQDVAQTTVGFSRHRLLALAEEQAQTRLQVGRHIVARLTQLVLARIVAVNAQTKDVHLQHAYLGMKLRMLEHGRNGMQALVTDPRQIELQIADVERAFKETAEGETGAKSSVLTMEGYIGHINAVLAHAEQYVRLTRVDMRVDLKGTKVEEPTSEDPVNELELTDLFIGEGLSATIALVRIPRTEMGPKEDLLSQAERFL
jgi:hypothetical protein